MNSLERERQHRASVERINHVQLVTGRGDSVRVDHEGTLLERARMLAEELRSHDATERGLAALDRLLRVVEERRRRETTDVAEFVAAVWGHRALPLVALRGLDPAIADDMLDVLDAYRYARLNLIEHVEGGPARVARAMQRTRLAKA